MKGSILYWHMSSHCEILCLHTQGTQIVATYRALTKLHSTPLRQVLLCSRAGLQPAGASQEALSTAACREAIRKAFCHMWNLVYLLCFLLNPLCCLFENLIWASYE